MLHRAKQTAVPSYGLAAICFVSMRFNVKHLANLRPGGAAEQPQPFRAKFGKRKVALHLAYVGTAYRGASTSSPATFYMPQLCPIQPSLRPRTLHITKLHLLALWLLHNDE